MTQATPSAEQPTAVSPLAPPAPAPLPATVVDPVMSPNLATTARPNPGAAPTADATPATTVDDRIAEAQQRPVDSRRIRDWSQAVLRAWDAVRAGSTTEQDVVAVSDTVTASPTLGNAYEVQRGDSLWTIARALWPDVDLTTTELEATWQLLYTWNAERLGDDPDSLPRGLVLQIPVDLAPMA